VGSRRDLDGCLAIGSTDFRRWLCDLGLGRGRRLARQLLPPVSVENHQPGGSTPFLSPMGNGDVDSLEARVTRLLTEYAQTPLPSGPLDRVSLRDDLGVESLSLVSLVVRLGDEVGVDTADAGLELGELATVSDLVALARRLDARAP